MTDLKEVSVHIDDVDKAIDLVGGFVNTLQIPANRAVDFAATQKVLFELKQLIAQQRAQLPKLEVVPEQEKTAA